jgi:alpha-amylase
MAVGLIAWARFQGPAAGQRVTVPAPTTEPGKPFLWDFLHAQAANLATSFDIVQLPPWSLAEGGAAPGCDGYGLFERRNLNGTRYGSLESLMAAIAALNAHGCQTYGDLVLHQMSGENGGPGVFKYSGKDGNTIARGETAPGWFRGGLGGNDPIPPFRPEDDVPVPADDAAFGRELSYQNAEPAGVTEEDAKDYLTWVHARTGAVGYRFDDTKGTHAPSVRRIMDSLPTIPFYSEYFDGNPANLNWWATSSPMNGRSAVQDFPLHFRIQAACNNFDATQFEQGGAGYFEWNSGLSVGFVDNPDTDTTLGEQVVSNKGLAYAYLLTLPLRLALVYGKDYFPDSVWPGAYGLHYLIDNLTWIARMFAFGNYKVRWVDKDVHVASRDGNGGATGWSGGLLTALNFNTLSPRTITCATPFGPNRWLHDYTGHHGDISTDANGNATFTIPSNAFAAGQSYLCFAPGGVSQAFTNRARSTTQSYLGLFDLDIRPAMNGTHVLPQRVFCAKGGHISLALSLSGAREALPTGWAINATVNDSDGTLIAQLRIGTAATVAPPKALGKAARTGWHTVTVEGFNLPADGAGYRLDINYTGHPG